jgi:PIN domain nuclease of toxin-antitoxin system
VTGLAVYVTDTHPLIWYASGRHGELSKKALRAYRAADSGRSQILVPAVVLWETALLERIGRVRLANRFAEWVDALLAQPGFELAALSPADIAEAVKFNINDDIFDGAIVAAATTREVPLITRDGGITDSGIVEVVW